MGTPAAGRPWRGRRPRRARCGRRRDARRGAGRPRTHGRVETAARGAPGVGRLRRRHAPAQRARPRGPAAIGEPWGGAPRTHACVARRREASRGAGRPRMRARAVAAARGRWRGPWREGRRTPCPRGIHPRGGTGRVPPRGFAPRPAWRRARALCHAGEGRAGEGSGPPPWLQGAKGRPPPPLAGPNPRSVQRARGRVGRAQAWKPGSVTPLPMPAVASPRGRLSPSSFAEARRLLHAWRPHSVLVKPAQRPARGSSSGPTGRVQGAHPMLG